MCGIAGFVTLTDSPALNAFRQSAVQVMAHRGPDDVGEYFTGQVCLLHRRLSILDLSPLGHQPMSTPEGRYSIAFNGEIYNYVELREQLAREGQTFRSQSDTEVLLYALVRWGPSALRRLVGMFAFALYDRDRRTVLLARDFFGIKPLYYCRSGDGLAFASEIKALRPLVSGRVRANRVLDYLRDGLTDRGRQTMFAEIDQLPAAHYLEIDVATGRAGEPTRYWDIDRRRRLDITFPEAVARVRELFLDSVRLHLRSDVPVGAALSGGIDSSAIVAAMRAVAPQADLRTFTFAADDDVIGEEKYADIVSHHAHAVARKVRLGPGDLLADLDRLVAGQDEPFGSTSIYAQFRVFRLAAESGVKVMLDGQGADEMLAGYHGYFPARMASMLRQGQWVDAYRFASAASARPGVGSRAGLISQALRPLVPNALQARARGLMGRTGMPGWLDRRWFDRRGVAPAPPRPLRMSDSLQERLYHTLTETSLPMLLRYEDRNSMAWSIESRVPFLTPALAEFFQSLPEAYLISPSGETKYVFREAMRGLVPNEILDRKDKIGFATPERRWLGELAPWVDSILTPDRLARTPAISAVAARREWHAVRDGKARFDWRIWRMVNLVRWAEVWDAQFDRD